MLSSLALRALALGGNRFASAVSARLAPALRRKGYWFWLDGHTAKAAVERQAQDGGGIPLSIVLFVALGGDRFDYEVIMGRQETVQEMHEGMRALGGLLDQCPSTLFEANPLLRSRIESLSLYLADRQAGRTNRDLTDAEAMDSWQLNPQEIEEIEERVRRWNRI